MPAATEKPGSGRLRRRTAKEYGPDPIDRHVGRRLRLARELAGLTQAEIGQKLGMSFQVVQKYEQGEIRISASRLMQLSTTLGRPVSFLFEGLETAADQTIIARREVELVRAFRLIANPQIRQHLLELIKGMGGDLQPSEC